MFKNAMSLERLLNIIGTIWKIKNAIYSFIFNFTVI
jgi:hypothetical protein